MEQKNKLKLNSGGLLVFILTVGVFGIINMYWNFLPQQERYAR